MKTVLKEQRKKKEYLKDDTNCSDSSPNSQHKHLKKDMSLIKEKSTLRACIERVKMLENMFFYKYNTGSRSDSQK